MLGIAKVMPAQMRKGEFIAEVEPIEGVIVPFFGLREADEQEEVWKSLNLLASNGLVARYPILQIVDLVTPLEGRPQSFRVNDGVVAVNVSDEGVINRVYSRDVIYTERPS